MPIEKLQIWLQCSLSKETDKKAGKLKTSKKNVTENCLHYCGRLIMTRQKFLKNTEQKTLSETPRRIK